MYKAILVVTIAYIYVTVLLLIDFYGLVICVKYWPRLTQIAT